jgi:hypothetical protein
MHKIGNPLYYAAAATTAIAGILHLILVLPPTNPYALGTNILFETFFIVAGIAQIFWALPMVKRWGKIWYYIGIAGTAILTILWALTRVPNPITGGRAIPIDEIGIAIVVFQIAYIVITVIIIAKERSRRVQMIRDDNSGN